MGRGAVWVILGLAIVAVAVFAFMGGGSEVEDDGELALGDPDTMPEDDAASPALIGSGRAAPVTAAGPAKYAITGKVLDKEGAPQAGISVVALKSGRAWIPGDPSSWNWVDDHFASRMASLAQPEKERHPLVAETTSGEDGSFTLKLRESAKYEVHARPVPPNIGTYNEISVYDKKPEQETTLKVLAGTPLKGRVVDAQDNPVPCVVTASWYERSSGFGLTARWRSGPIVAEAPNATFALPAVPEGSLNLGVLLKNRASLSGFSVKTPHEDEAVLRIPTSTNGIRGVVTDKQEQPIAGATVLISVTTPKKEGEKRQRTSEVKALTAADGSYLAQGLPAGEVSWVRAKAKGFLTYAQYKNQAPWKGAKVEDDKTLQLDFTMERGGTVRGRVLLQEKNTPIAGARVRLMRSQQPGMASTGGKLSATTDASGAFEIKGVGAGRYVAIADHKAYYLPQLGSNAPNVMRPGMNRSAPPALTVVITGDDSEVERDLFLLRGFPLTGRVENAQGKGVGGADINARQYGLSQVAWRWGIGGMTQEALATSEADGSFETVAMPPRDDWVLYAKKKGFVGVFSDAVAVGDGVQTPELKLKLDTGATIRGKLVCEDKSLLQTAQVGCWGQGSELRPDSSFKKTEPDGTFELTDIPPGDWTVNVWMNGRQGIQKQVKGLKAGEVREGIVLEIAQGVTVSGVLVDKDGAAVANQMIYCQAGNHMVNATTDSEGQFTFSGIKEGRAKLMIFDGSGPSRQIGKSFDAPAENLRIVYEKEPTATVSGQVNLPDGSPVPVCFVSVTSSSKPSHPERIYYGGNQGGVEAINGKFQVQARGTPPFTVKVTNPRDVQGRPLNLMASSKKVDDPSKPVTITLEGGMEVRGRVVDTKNKPVMGVTVMCNNIQAQPNSLGEYVIGGLRKGKVSVTLAVKGSWIRPKPQSVEAGTKNVDFVLEKGMKIVGHAYQPDGQPLTRGYANAQWPAVGDYPRGGAGSQLDNKGKFTINGIPKDAVVKVTVQSWSYSGGEVGYAPKIVENVRPGTDDIEVRLGEGLTVEGVVLRANGKPATGMYVNARPSEGGGHAGGYVQVGDDGSFKIAGLEAKKYKIHVHRQDGGANPEPVEVDPPQSGVRIQLPKTVSLSGRLQGAGESASEWRVTAYREDKSHVGRANVDADGTFSLDTVPDGKALMLIAQRRSTTETRYAMKKSVQPGADGVVMTLKEGMTISGTVDMSGAGTERGSVSARGADMPWSKGAMIAEDETFEIKGLPPGRYHLTAHIFNANLRGSQKNVDAGTSNVRITVKAP